MQRVESLAREGIRLNMDLSLERHYHDLIDVYESLLA